jgi:cobyrinic acid a,c-diamide synthase
MHECRALMVSGCASGQGKTTVTAALALQARERGERVRLFKTGPDFLDPMVLQGATGEPVWQLDLFMGGEAHCQALLDEAMREAELVLVEGMMGLYDGAPSSADLAARFGLPVLAVIDGSAMAGTFGAIAQGLRDYRRPAIELLGVVANRVGGEAHARMLFEALPEGVAGLGWLPRDEAIELPQRHLGLAADHEGIAAALGAAARCWHDGPSPLRTLPARRLVDTPERAIAPGAQSLAGRRIAIARDAAFCFLYPANLATLQALGATCMFFSPLAGDALPACDAVWLPGGYPELHAARLSERDDLREALQTHQREGRPLLAECGGMMMLFAQLRDLEGHAHRGWGLLPGTTQLHPRLIGLGLQQVDLPEGRVRGHSFHHSSCDTPLTPIAQATNPNGGSTAERVYRVGRSTASYLHLYFPSNPQAVASLLSGR